MAPRWPRSSSHSIEFAAAAAAIWALVVELTTSSASIATWLPDLAVGLALIVAALAAGRGSRRVAAALLLAAVSWFFANLAEGTVGWLATVGDHTPFLHRGVLVAAGAAIASQGRRTVALITTVIASTLISPLMERPVAMLLWSAAAIVATVIERRGVGHPLHRLAVAGAAAATLPVAALAVSFLVSGSAPPSDASVALYQVTTAAAGLTIAACARASRLRRDRIADAVTEAALGSSPYVRQLLARALRDPRVEIAFASPEGWVDEFGEPRHPVTAGGGREAVDVTIDGLVIAQLLCEQSAAQQPQVVAAVHEATAVAAHHARLRAALRHEAEELEYSRRRLLVAADEQRVQLAQALAAECERPISAIGERLASLGGTDDETIREIVGRSADRVRNLAADLERLAAGLGPAALAGGDLAAALADLAHGSELPISVIVECDGLPENVAAAAYFICAEAVSNALKHAGASRLTIVARQTGEVLHLQIADDGRGGARPVGASGLVGLADRVAVFGGSLTVDSPPGRGTTVTASLDLTHRRPAPTAGRSTAHGGDRRPAP